jgi:hydrogenase maturation protease
LSHALVVGYGSPLRGDDAVGWHVAQLLQADRTLTGVTVLTRHQLTPELAEDMAGADVVVLVDASTAPAGTVSVAPVVPVDPGSALSHEVTPAALLALAERLYGRAPRAFVLSVGASSFAPDPGLSSPVSAALPLVLAELERLVAQP